MKSHIIKTLQRFILVSAVIHLSIVAVIAVTGDMSALNYFAIVGLDFFFPAISQGLTSLIISLIVAVVIFLILFFAFKDSDQKK